MKRITIYIFLLLPLYSHAEWFCKEAASQAEGDTFFSCGVATSNFLYEARKNALMHAKEEFRAFCDESAHCQNNKYIITPLRTDCNKTNETYTCYRGLQYQILDQKRDYSDFQLTDLENEIRNKEHQLQLLHQKLQRINEINDLNQKIDDLEKIDNLELQIDQLESKRNYWPKGKAGMQFFYIQIPFAYDNENLFGIGPEYEHLIYRDLLGVKFNLNYLMGLSTKEDLNDRGTPNSTSSSDYHSHKGVDLNISIPIHIKNISLAPKFGYTSVKYKSTTKSYNNSGVALTEQSQRHNFDDNYIGLNLRYSNKFFIDIEPRKYTNSNKTIMKIGVGINIDF